MLKTHFSLPSIKFQLLYDITKTDFHILISRFFLELLSLNVTLGNISDKSRRKMVCKTAKLLV